MVIFHNSSWSCDAVWLMLVIIGSGNCLLPVRLQVITWTSAGLFPNRSLGSKSKCVKYHLTKCLWKCRLQNILHLSRPRCVTARPVTWLLPSVWVQYAKNRVYQQFPPRSNPRIYLTRPFDILIISCDCANGYTKSYPWIIPGSRQKPTVEHSS